MRTFIAAPIMLPLNSKNHLFVISVPSVVEQKNLHWFEAVASPAIVQSIYRFKTDALSVNDDFAPIVA